MDSVIISSVISLSGIAALASVILFIAAKKFKVEEDPRIDQVDEALPGANCGGCGYAGCRNFAEAVVKQESLDGLFCPVGGNDLNKDIASILGIEAEEKDPMVAVVRCSGSFKNAPAKVEYEGPESCYMANMLHAGASGCPNGCLGLGDCVESCPFDAIKMDPETGLPIVIEEKCTACNNCVVACPRNIIELRKKGKKSRRIFVSCVNSEKGAAAKKSCSTACIGCKKCVKECPFDAIVVENFLAYIDYDKCKLCKKCVPVCPTGAILAVNFPVKKAKPKKDDKKVETKDNKKTETKQLKESDEKPIKVSDKKEEKEIKVSETEKIEK